ncbi:hypothetical protein AALP_AA3G337300 [Arabis alpina]|uniref:Uncharacterized protein n=1 Tax=Arabis alpina TaxID=50452 RepID=A0A087HDF2_ARAAL|nr:hypothetical protein AALP_AA3G337300 [Arabis alpina]
MSRCYPFPSLGYVRNEIVDGSLIKSIKGAKEKVKKDRKHKRKERDNEADRSRKHRHKRRRKDDKKVNDRCGLVNSEVEFLEKSCLTVELEQQTSSQTSCDSFLHSNDRPKQVQSQPLDGRHNDSEISKRIRLASKEQKDHEVMMMTNKDQKPCSSPEKLYASSTAPRDSVGPRDANFGSLREISTKLSKEKKPNPQRDVESHEKNTRISRQLGKEKMPSSSSCSLQELEKPSCSHQEVIGCSKCPPSLAVRFLNLIENWTPDRVESKLTDSVDQEWWLYMKLGAKQDNHHKIINQTISEASGSMVWPTARFLPEAELHALPFTVPF